MGCLFSRLVVLAWASGVKSESARERVREGQLSLVPFFKALFRRIQIL